MAKDDPGCAAVVAGFEEVGGGVVGEMADAGEDTLLDLPGIGAVAEHFEIVIGFDHEEIEVLELGFDVGWDVAEICGEGHADAFGLEDEADRVRGVMRDGEGADGDVADLEGLPCGKVLDSGEPGGVLLRL